MKKYLKIKILKITQTTGLDAEYSVKCEVAWHIIYFLSLSDYFVLTELGDSDY